MKDLLTSKPIDIAFLLLCLLTMDLCKISDPELRYAILGLIASSTGVRGISAAWGGLTSMIGNTSSTAAAPAVPPAPPSASQ